jgi:hypothetical protein
MRRVRAIAWLTFSEGVRMRIVLVFVVVLVFLVLRMPFALRGDETLTGRLQSFLAYSLGALGLLLSLATIFFSCATLTGEIKECSLQLVVTKPVTRFQILVGKWLGVNLLNLLIVVLCGGAIYGFARFIQSRPEQFERDRLQVRDVVWTARLAARPAVPSAEIAQAAAEQVQERVRLGEIDKSKEPTALAERIGELLNQWRTISNGDYRVYRFEGLAPPEREDTVVQIRYKAVGVPLPPDELVTIGWVIYDPLTGQPLAQRQTRDQAGIVHQFLVQAGPVIRDRQLVLQVVNPYNPYNNTAIFFEGDDSLEVLYKVSSFELNFLKALLIIVLQLALLSALGIFLGVFVSFPVACLATCAFFLICLGMPFWLESIGANLQMTTPATDPYGFLGPTVRKVLVPFMKVAFPNFVRYSGTGHLVDGEYISGGLLLRCLVHTLVYGGVLLLLPGWLIFSRREIAEVAI